MEEGTVVNGDRFDGVGGVSDFTSSSTTGWRRGGEGSKGRVKGVKRG